MSIEVVADKETVTIDRMLPVAAPVPGVGRPGNLIGKSQYLDDLLVSPNMSRPAFWNPRGPPWDSRLRRSPFQRPFWVGDGWVAVGAPR